MNFVLKDYISKSQIKPKMSIKIKSGEKGKIKAGAYSGKYEIIDIIDALKRGNYDDKEQMAEQIGKEILPVAKGIYLDSIEKSYQDEKTCTTAFSKQQFTELKDVIEKYKSYIIKHGIDINNKVDVLFAIYALLQKDIKYFNPNVMTGSWHSTPWDSALLGFIGTSSAYGALVNQYALCGGIENAFKLMCNYFNIACEQVSAPLGDIGHGINKVILENGEVSYIDLSSEIGMGQDGLHNGDKTLRETPLQKKEVTTEFFLLTKDQYYQRCYHTIQEHETGVSMNEEEKNRRMGRIVQGLYHTIPMSNIAGRTLEQGRENIHIQKGIYTNPLLESAIDATEQQTTTGDIERTANRRLRIAVQRENPDKDKTE